MKKINVFHSWPLIIFIISTLSSIAWANPYRPESQKIRKEAWELNSELNYFSTTGFYNRDGELVAMDEGEDFQKMDVDLNVRYGYGHQLELRAGARFRYLSSTSSVAELTNSGIESFLIGAKYTLFPKQKSPWKFAVDAYLRNTLYTNDVYKNQNPPNDELVLGDSGTSFLVGGHASYHARSKNFILSGSAFIHRPPNNLSNEIVYEIEAMIPFSKLALGGGIEGIYSLETDEFTEAPNQKPAMATGVTNLFNSINRSRMMAYAKGLYRFDEWSVYAKAGVVASGTSTDEGNLIVGGLTWNFGGLDPKTARIQRFKEYNIEATVLQVSPRGKFLKIDKGMAQDVNKGKRFDIYETDYFGGNKLVATGIIFKVSSDQAIIKLDRMMSNKKVEAGFTARGQ